MVTRRKADKFPLWLHKSTGQFGKKFHSRSFSFGKDRDAALTEYVRVKDDLEAGRTPRVKSNGLTVVDPCNRSSPANRKLNASSSASVISRSSRSVSIGAI